MKIDNDNIYPDPTTDADFRRQVIDMLLGKDWYVVDPLSQSQVNTIAIEEIKRKYCQSNLDELLGRIQMTAN